MKNRNGVGTSLEMQRFLDSYFIELYENGEKKTVNQLSEELHVHNKTVYRYIAYCQGMRMKYNIFHCMMNTLVFGTNSDYYNLQQSYLEKVKLLERKKKSLMVIKELLARQKIREDQENLSKKLK